MRGKNTFFLHHSIKRYRDIQHIFNKINIENVNKALKDYNQTSTKSEPKKKILYFIATCHSVIVTSRSIQCKRMSNSDVSYVNQHC